MGLIRTERESRAALLADAVELAKCVLEEANGDKGVALLYATCMNVLTAKALLTSGAFGEDYRLTPVTIGTTPVKLLDTDSAGRVRKVTVAVDSAVGGQAPTIRVGQGSVNSNGGGFRINPAALNELGEVGPDVTLQAVSSSAIQAYVIERLASAHR